MLAARPKLLPLENCNRQFLAAPNADRRGSYTRQGKHSTSQIPGKKWFRLLVVDADPELREIRSGLLPADSCECVFEESPDKIEEILPQQAPFDTILVDLFSPVEGIFELISAIKGKYPNTEVVFTSRLTDEESWVEFIQRGVYDLLPKPMDRRAPKSCHECPGK
jgi:DNA-binding NtrC family response regulator